MMGISPECFMQLAEIQGARPDRAGEIAGAFGQTGLNGQARLIASLSAKQVASLGELSSFRGAQGREAVAVDFVEDPIDFGSKLGAIWRAAFFVQPRGGGS
jgi:hypothetical protein